MLNATETAVCTLLNFIGPLNIVYSRVIKVVAHDNPLFGNAILSGKYAFY